MPDTRYRLHDGHLLRRLMRNPLPGGTAYTVRSLAEVTGLSYSKIQRLVTEERPIVDREHADRIAAAVQEQRKALFSPTPSPFEDGDHIEEEPVDPAERTLRARLAANIGHAMDPDPASRTAKARAAADAKFIEQAREMHPDASDERIAKVAEHLRSAHFARLGLASGKARRARRAASTPKPTAGAA